MQSNQDKRIDDPDVLRYLKHDTLAEGKELVTPLLKALVCNAGYSASPPFPPWVITKVEWHGGKGHLDNQNLNCLRRRKLRNDISCL